jgi:hypothetical protein
VDTHLGNSRPPTDPRLERRRIFAERCLAVALRAQRMTIEAKQIGEHGDIEDMREAIRSLATTLERIVDLVVVTAADVSKRKPENENGTYRRGPT